MDGLDTLKAKYLSAVATAADEAALEEVRLAALGKKGEISAMMATLGKMDPDARKAAGASLNALKDEIDAALAPARQALPMPRWTNGFVPNGSMSHYPAARAAWAPSIPSAR
jgi:phenylalanyl-tRNA synthetase alpha chain